MRKSLNAALTLFAVTAPFICNAVQAQGGWFQRATGRRTPEPIRVIAPRGISTGRVSPFRNPQPSTSTLPMENYSYAANWTSWHYNGGNFETQNRRDWIENQNGRIAFRFREISRSNDAIELFDDSRQMTVRLTATTMHWKQPNTNWNFLYNGQAR